MRYCEQCGTPNLETARFCKGCGARLREMDPQSSVTEVTQETAATMPEEVQQPAPAEVMPETAPEFQPEIMSEPVSQAAEAGMEVTAEVCDGAAVVSEISTDAAYTGQAPQQSEQFDRPAAASVPQEGYSPASQPEENTAPAQQPTVPYAQPSAYAAQSQQPSAPYAQSAAYPGQASQQSAPYVQPAAPYAQQPSACAGPASQQPSPYAQPAAYPGQVPQQANPYAQPAAYPGQAPQQSVPYARQAAYAAPVKTNEGKISALSVIAFVCAFLFPLAGLIMGIIDLCSKENRAKGLSIAAVVVSACFIAISLVTALTFMPILTELLEVF